MHSIMMKKIAIQGIRGCFHDIAAHRFFRGEGMQLVECSTFEKVFAAMREDADMVALVAIENTIAGSLLHNYELLCDSGLTIVGEHKLRIRHSIMCLPEDNWEDLTEVNSHPVALMQCRAFLETHPGLKVVEVADTAGAAANIGINKLRGHAAICHHDAADIYGLKVLQEGVETNKHNFTRFLVLANQEKAGKLRDIRQADKASLAFTLPHEEGSLSAILSVLSFYKLNLTKKQSLPIIGKEWQYRFYVDVNFTSAERLHQAINAITPLTQELKTLGIYCEGEQTV